jgi:capsular polysaccharide biosynthesis protein
MIQDNSPHVPDYLKVASFLYKWRKTLLIVAISTAIISAFLSSPIFITPLYKSSVIMYPSSGNSISKALLNDNPMSRQDILEFGEDEQTEQVLQILNSSRIRERVISRFKLDEHYGIDSNSRYYKTRLYDCYEANIKFKRTEYMAIKISVLDKDAQMAADIANEIAALLDSVKNDLQKERAMEGFRIVEAEYNTQQSQILKMEDSLTKLRMLGVHDYESQSEVINQQLAIELAKGNARGIAALENKLNVLAQYGGAYVSLRDALEHEKKQLSYVKARYEEAKIDAHESIPQKFIVENAYKAERKSYPVTWVVMVISTIGALLTASIVLLLIDKYPALIKLLKNNELES